MKKRLMSFILIFIIAFNFSVVYADDLVTSDDLVASDEVETYVLPFVGVPIAEAVVYLMGVLGVAGVAGVASYENKDLFAEWGQKQVDNFKVKCLALGLTAELVDSWLEDLSNGVLKKSGEVWSAFKEWVKELRVSSGAGIEGAIYDGTVRGDKSGSINYDLYSSLGSSVLGSGISFGSATDYSSYIFSPLYDGYVYIAKSSGYLALYYAYADTGGTYSYKYKRVSERYGTEESSAYATYGSTITINDVKYRYSIVGYVNSADTVTVPAFPTLVSSTALTKIVTGDFTPVLPESDYTIIGGINDLDKVNVGNIGNVSYPVASDEVFIDWGNVGSIPGVIGGVVGGTTSWSDALTSGGILVDEDGLVVDDEGVTDVTKPDLGSLNDYKLDLTELFPFCLPFDFIDFINILSAEPETPYFEYDMPLPYGINGGSYKFVIDLSAFDGAASLLRKMETLAFIVGLIFVTREKMIRG